jgi:hypothetical protein
MVMMAMMSLLLVTRPLAIIFMVMRGMTLLMLVLVEIICTAVMAMTPMSSMQMSIQVTSELPKRRLEELIPSAFSLVAPPLT